MRAPLEPSMAPRRILRWLAGVCLAVGIGLAGLGLVLARMEGPWAERARDRIGNLLQMRGRWLGIVPIGFDAMPPWPPLGPPEVGRPAARGPLRPHPTNPRYFADDRGEPVYLTGSHTWTNLQDAGDGDPPPVFDYTAFLDRVESYHLNFFRLWRWEHTRWGSWHNMAGFRIAPHPYLRTGPGVARDGLPKFDLTQFDERYFVRLRERVEQARQRGFYVSVMLFNGWSIEDKGITWGLNPWPGHPFHAENNVNGLDGDPNGDGQGTETHSMSVPAVLALQEAYVRRVVDTVNDLDNVLFEISNESGPEAAEWQYHLIRLIKEHEASKPLQHPVGMTVLYPLPGDSDARANAILESSPADWISPAGDPHTRPAATGRQVILADTDHLCGICGDRKWVWMSLTRGENPLFMDVWNCAPWWYPNDCARPEWPSLRTSLGYARDMVRLVPLARMVPRGEVSSTGHALVDTTDHRAYLVYAAEGGAIEVDLSDGTGTFDVQWLSPATGQHVTGGPVEGGARRQFTPPFPDDVVLLLRSRS